MKKRTLAMLLALVLVISIVPMAAMAEECAHVGPNHAVGNGDGTHNYICDSCNEPFETNVSCSYDETGFCYGCQQGKPPVKCEHVGVTEVIANNDGTHSIKCHCGEIIETDKCGYVDGECPSCHAHAPVPGCAEGVHSGLTKVVGNGDGTHNYVCAKCGDYIETVDCEYDDDGFCYGCQQGKPPVAKCDHTGNNWAYEDNGNGTHKVICKDCGKVESENAECVYTNGVCRACGSKEPEQKPATDKDLDNVPKTGDNGSVIVITSMTVLSVIAGAAFVFNKKHAF